MTLREQQSLFVVLVGKLIEWCSDNGYELSFSEAYRSPTEAAINAQTGAGIANSLHTQRLAIDLNLFKSGELLSTVDDYRPLAEYWKSLHPLCRAGVDFLDHSGNPKPDADHFSMEWNGIK